ncbi:hypothetical protein DENSPDRAFT_664681 [Dentipellis sp. KUC8613]|nr:hypothetical protein DENSPDRAFT_664681 [Dentipellis sp. KUC8613]
MLLHSVLRRSPGAPLVIFPAVWPRLPALKLRWRTRLWILLVRPHLAEFYPLDIDEFLTVSQVGLRPRIHPRQRNIFRPLSAKTIK